MALGMATNATDSEASQRPTTPPTPNGTTKGEVSPPPHLNGKVDGQHHQQDDESHGEHTMVIDSLRAQNQELYTQVKDLNSKLVQSYERVSDLEHNLELTATSQSHLHSKITQLEVLQSQHTKLVDSGELVERWQVKNELTGLMERATVEAAQRGEAESARKEIERELEELSASLFGQANRMVVEARVGREESERRLEEAERALKGTEEAMRGMQKEMQALIEKEKEPENATVERLQLTYDHVSYLEFLAFLAHLRQLHVLTPKAVPAMSTLLQLPFLARLSVEDSDPTLRLDFAPSLNWLTRRSVQAAIYSGQLSVEPLTISNSHSHPMLPDQCALCGAKSQASTTLHIFRLPASSTTPTTTTAFVSSATNININIPYYPLCASGWCLARLRTTCSLWSFIRTGIVDKIWDELLPPPVPPPIHPSLSTSSDSSANSTRSSTTTTANSRAPTSTPPPIPPRRRTLWGIATALSERAVSWSDEKGKKLVSGVNVNNIGIAKRVVSSSGPTAVPKTESRSSTHTPTRTPTSSPPPLPKRSGNRSMGVGRVGSPAPALVSSSSVGPGTGIVSIEREKEDAPTTLTGESPNGVPTPTPNSDSNSEPKRKSTDTTGSSSAGPGPVALSSSDPALAASNLHIDKPNPNPTPPLTPPPPRTHSQITAVPNPVGSRSSTPTSFTGSGAPPPIPRRAPARRKVDGGGESKEEKKLGPELTDEGAAAATTTKPVVEKEGSESSTRSRSRPVSEVKGGDGKRASVGPVAAAVAGGEDATAVDASKEEAAGEIKVESSNVTDPKEPLLSEASAVEDSEPESRRSEGDSEQQRVPTLMDVDAGADAEAEALGGGGKAPDVEGINGVAAEAEAEAKPTPDEETKKQPPRTSSESEESKADEPKHRPESSESSNNIRQSQLLEPQRQSWELKTWGDLVRLREDMFWARVGRLLSG